MKPFARIFALAFVLLVTSAHVGSPDVWFDGPAGPYSVRVLVKPPRVVPGLADIIVRVRGGASAVHVTPSHWDTGKEGAPPPDLAKQLAGDPEVFTAQLWLMARGAYRITVTVDGARGQGVAIVPVTATSTERLPMSAPLQWALRGGLLFLLIGLISIVGSGVRESLLPPGVTPDARNLRRSRIGMATAAILGVVILGGGWKWWGAVDRKHRAKLDHPWTSVAELRATPAGGRELLFTITDTTWMLRADSQWLASNRRSVAASLIPDHGKLMHLFMMRENDLSSFAHLHPTSHDQVRFTASAPALPAGRYRVYGDIVEESGESRTIATVVDATGGSSDSTNAFESPADEDDAAWSGGALGTLRSTEYRLADGAIMRWMSPQNFVAGAEIEIKVAVVDSAGAPAVIEPYMGMPGHAVVANGEGTVFVHLHPLGTISTAAQNVLAGRSDGKPAMHHMSLPPEASVLTFPYSFPRAGRYRVWVQVKRDARIMTGAFDVDVS